MRRLLAVLLTAVTALALTGCLKVDMELEVHENSTVSGSMTLGVSKAMKEMMEGMAAEFGGEDGDDSLDDEFFETDEVPEGATVEPYEDDKFIGQTMTFDKVSLEELNESATDEDSDDWTLRRDGDTIVFEAAGDFGGEEAAEAESSEMDLGFDQFFAESELRVAVTFPGEVIESNGEVDGRTVTWTPEFGEQLTMRAVAKAEKESGLGALISSSSDDESGTSVVLVAVVAGVVVLLLIVVGLLLAGRRKKADTPA